MLNRKLDQEFQRIFSVEPNDLGNRYVTGIYKAVTGPLKQMPFLYLVPLSFLTGAVAYIVLGHMTISLVSLLQYGF